MHDAARSVVDAGDSYDNPRLAYELARLYTDYNQVHPFRDGNGRAGAMLLHGVATRCGRTLDLTVTNRAEWYSAAADSMGPRGRDGRDQPPAVPADSESCRDLASDVRDMVAGVRNRVVQGVDEVVLVA